MFSCQVRWLSAASQLPPAGMANPASANAMQTGKSHPCGFNGTDWVACNSVCAFFIYSQPVCSQRQAL